MNLYHLGFVGSWGIFFCQHFTWNCFSANKKRCKRCKMTRGSKRAPVAPVNPIYGNNNHAWVKASRRVFCFFYIMKITLKPNHRLWNHGILRAGPEKCCWRDGRAQASKPQSTNTSWITDCPGRRPPPTLLLLLCDICMSVRLCCVFMFAFYEDSGLCSLSAVTHEEYFRHCCQLCLQTPVLL